MSQEVCGKLHLISLPRSHQFRECHDPCVVNQNVKGTPPRTDKLSHRSEIRQIKMGNSNLRITGCFFDIRCHDIAGFDVPDGQSHFCASESQRSGGLDSDTGRSPCYDDTGFGKINTIYYLFSGGVKTECRFSLRHVLSNSVVRGGFASGRTTNAAELRVPRGLPVAWYRYGLGVSA